MANDDWYRNRTWDPDIAEAFHIRLARSQSAWTRWQYLTIQADHLTYAVPRLLEPALDLHQRALQVRGIEPDWESSTWHDVALLTLRLGRMDEAEEALRKAVAACPPTDRAMQAGGTSPEERLARLLMFRKGRAALSEARELLAASERRWLPEYQALTTTEVLDLDGEPLTDPESAAEGFVTAIHLSNLLDDDGVDALFAATPAALRTLDAMHLRDLPTSEAYLAQQYVPGLGAWVGRVMVRSYGGSWVPGQRLWNGRVALPDGREIDPFQAAYDAVYVGVPLTGCAS